MPSQQLQSQIPEEPHLQELDGFRAFSILAVLACHMLPLGPAPWQLNVTAGYMGMSVFFALSGFLISRFLWDRPDVKVFLIRRTARIMPLVLLVSFIYTVLLQHRLDSFAAANLYVLNYWHSAIIPYISPLWSLGVEMHFYLGIALAVLFFGRRGFVLVPVAAAVVMALRVEHNVFGAIGTHFRIDEILSGSMLALAFIHRRNRYLTRFWTVLPALFWPLVLLWLLSCWPPSGALGYMRPYLAAGMIGSVLAMRKGSWQAGLLSHRILAYIATISFALYVWHSPFRHDWFASGGEWDIYLVKRPLGILAAFALAHLSTFYFERPITQWAKRYTSRPRLATA
ncbi:acyltransferase family protein [Rhodovulum visakhapatnamense]|uniref:Peptidoglycan/LPS O-acetylase OafA/YrhL n=1 Tax=Rhodovulum visakhapatnamense TaxID=364297 RepID=A0A4R8F3I3_9RHOB|nr:acyltransferase [Rhodovulum visakhapatnamense]TDX19612.1 peptidoglycan/LPS O-acetylase OafA/YrhL [Rhodovulum visakhapatnamense]